jgi:hypothetical protein
VKPLVDPPVAAADDAKRRSGTPFESEGAGVSAIFEQADELELYALSSNPWRDALPDTRPRLDRYPIIGSTKVIDSKQRRLLVDTYYHEAKSNVPARLCFEPRHALVARRGKQRITILICYDCGQHEVHFPTGRNSGLQRWKGERKAVLDHLLSQAGIIVEEREPGQPTADMRFSRGVESERSTVHILNGVYATCFETEEMWKLHEGGHLGFRFTIDAKGAPRGVTGTSSTVSPRTASCFVREIGQSSLFQAPGGGRDVEVEVDWKLPVWPPASRKQGRR